MTLLSLRTRLVGLTLLAVALVWLLTTLVTWREARHELEELLAHPPDTSAAHFAKERNEVAAEIAGQLLKPILFALPALAVLLVIAIGLALAPLRQLARDVAARAPDRLDPLPVETLPTEVAPLVIRLNSLFSGINRARQNERRFTADAAHELRTPLAALKAQAQVALASVDAVERQRALNQILAGCDRATHLVQQLLTLARLDPHASGSQAQTCDLHALAGAAVAEAAQFAWSKKVEIDLAEGPAVELAGHAGLISILLRNLVDNAIRYSPEGGSVHVRAACDGAEATLTVTDQGPGIPAGERDKVGQRFYRILGSGETGSGLGLSIVKQIAELHGASISLDEGKQGAGLSVTVRFGR